MLPNGQFVKALQLENKDLHGQYQVERLDAICARQHQTSVLSCNLRSTHKESTW